jgi:hypothetical protein
MTRVTVAQQNFSGGELSPALAGRFDLSIYYNGASWLQNFIATVQGMARYRSGSKFVWNTRNNAEAVLIPFEYNTLQAYILEFTDQKMRIIKDGGIITATPQSITAISATNPAVVTYSGADNYANGDPIILDDIVGMTELNNQEYVVANVDTGANTFELQGVNATGFTAYVSGGTVAEIIEVTTPYLAADLFSLDYAQTNDTMYIVHPNYAPRKLTRSSHTAWTLGTYSRTSDPFAAGPPLNWPSKVAFFEKRLIFAASDASPQTIWGSVGGAYDDFTTGTDADDAFVYALSSGQANRIRWITATEDFLAIGTAGAEFKAEGGNNDPITPTNISIKPPSFYGSANIKPIRLDSHILYITRDKLTTRTFEFDAIQDGFTSINRNLTADTILQGRYGLADGAKQVAFQSGSPSINWIVRNDGALCGLTFEPREQVNGWHRHIAGGTYAGGKLLKPEYGSVATITQETGPDQVYHTVKRTIDGATVRYIEYFADQPTIPRFNDYYTGVKETDKNAYLQDLWEAQKRLWFVDSGIALDGTVAQTGTLSAATVGAGRTFTAGGATFAASDVGREIWGKAGGRAKITAYTSSTVVTVQVLKAFPAVAMAASAWYLTFRTISGLQHLEGQMAVGLIDGGVVENMTVEDGQVVLENQASYAIIGLGYLGIYQSMDIEGGGDNGPGVTKSKSISNIGIRFLNTLGCLIGTDLYKLERVTFRTTADLTSRPPPLFSGVKVKSVRDSWTEEKYIYCVQDKPLPCNIQLLVPRMQTNDG